MDANIRWTLTDLTFFAAEEMRAVDRNQEDAQAIQNLIDRGESFHDSLSIINDKCKKELIEYRKTLVSRASEEEQREAFDNLYEKYYSLAKPKDGLLAKIFGK